MKRRTGKKAKKRKQLQVYHGMLPHYLNQFERCPEEVGLTEKEAALMSRESFEGHLLKELTSVDDPEAKVSARTVLMEMCLGLIGNPTIFIESPELLRQMSLARFSWKDNRIVLPNGYDQSLFAFPKRIKFGNAELLPCIFGNNIRVIKETSGEIETNAKSIALYANISSLVGEPIYARGAIPIDQIPEAMDKGISSVMGGGVSKNHLEQIIQESLDITFRVCVALCFYAEALPDSFEKGFPNTISTRTKAKRKGFRIKCIHKPSKKTIHFRSGAEVALTAPRYHHGESGHVRYTTKRATVVGLKVDPSKIKNKG